MKLSRIPAAVAAFVATIAIGNRNTTQRFVRNVIDRGPIRRRKSSAVARFAPVSNGSLSVVPGSGLPRGCAVASNAIGRHRNVCRSFTGSRRSVVTAGAIGGNRKARVVHPRGRQPCRRFMACAASCLRWNVAGRFTRRGVTVMAT